MTQAQVRAFNARGAMPREAAEAPRASRMIRGYDAAGKVVFTTPASKLGRPSARQAVDAKTVRDRSAAFPGRVVRVQVDEMSGPPSDYLLDPAGALRTAYLIDGELVAAFC